MSLHRMPNGQYVDIEDGASQETIEKVRAMYPASKEQYLKQRKDEVQMRRAEADTNARAADIERRAQSYGQRASMANLFNAPLGGIFDKGFNALRAGYSSLAEGKDYTDEYQRNSEATERHIAAGRESAAPGTSYIPDALGYVASLAVNPLSAARTGGTALASGAARIAPRATTAIANMAAKAAPLMAKVAPKVAPIAAAGRAVMDNPVGRSVVQGAGQGAFSGALENVDNLRTAQNRESAINNVGNAALMGGIGGGVLGLGTAAARKGYTVVKDLSKSQAATTAYTKIQNALARSTNKVTGKPWTPEEIRAEIARAARAGNNITAMDLVPELRNAGGYLASRPGLKGAGDIEDFVTSRAELAPDRFDAKVRKMLGDNPDAFARKAEIKGQLKSDAEGTFSDEHMDSPYTWNDRLDYLINKGKSPAMKQALKHAMAEVEDDLDPATGQFRDPKLLGFVTNANGDVELTKVPSPRVIDYIRKGFNKQIGDALATKGGAARAKTLSKQVDALKAAIGETNPEHIQGLARQRDLYQQNASVELGQNFLSRMKGITSKGDARQLLEDMKKEGTNQSDLGTGVMDALLHLREKGENPAAIAQALMRSPYQKQVFAHVLGGRRALTDFQGFLKREAASAAVNRFINPMAGSKSNVLLQQGIDGGAGEAASTIGKSSFQGLAFGGKIGLISRGWREITRLSKSMSPEAQEELAQILISKGDDMPAGIKAANEYLAKRKRTSKFLQDVAGKIGALSTSGIQQE